eukprot:c13989_g1_i2.p1 GENE.c13989_g1_i2~~c13989_g1_i2.p1  ORF type:complete len:145 (-),score=26.11 c13989_g1_i2:111-545(-)
MVKLTEHLARCCNWRKLQRMGVYSPANEPPLISWWAVQCLAWVAIIIAQRLCMASMMHDEFLHRNLGSFGSAVLAPFEGVHARIVMVMVVLPSMINVCEFWIQDSFLKEGPRVEEQPQEKLLLLAERSGVAELSDVDSDYGSYT